jgi:hypothetical protein
MIVFGLLLFLSFWVIYKSPFFALNSRKHVAFWGWIVSIFGGIAVWCVYNKVYQIERVNADTFKFFDDAIIIGSYFKDYPIDVLKIFFGFYSIENETTFLILENTTHWFRPFHFGEFNDNQIVIRLNLLILAFSGGFYFSHLLIFNFLGFVGVWFLIKSLSKNVLLISPYLWGLVFLVPNAWLWNSGVLKEPILIFFLGLFLFGFWNKFNQSIVKPVILITSVLGLVMVKAYVLLCLLPGLLITTIYKKYNFWYKAIILYGVGVLFLIAGFYFLDINPSQVITQKQIDFNNVAQLSEANSYFETFKLEPNPLSLILNSPMALVNSIFRPFIWNSNSIFMLISSLENFGLFILLIFSLMKLKKEPLFLNQYKNLILIFSLNLYVLIGLTTTVSGALVRYKIPATILLSLLIIMILFKQKNFNNEKALS